MASGRVQLASVGIQDNFTVNEPSFTYFQKIYKKHTKFALETIDNPVDGSISFGTQINCVIPRRGDLIHAVHLRIELDALPAPYGYTDSIGNAIIEWAEFIIGGQLIQRITGEYMEMYTDLTISNSQQPAMRYMIGRTLTVNGLGPATNKVIYIVPLPFYFHGHDSLSVPMSAIDKQSIEVRVKLRDLASVAIDSTTGLPAPADITGTINKISMPVEYVFLTTEEINYMASRPIDYLVSQVQLSRYTIDPGLTVSKLLLNFVNPVKELYFVIQNKDTQNDWFNYGNTDPLVNLQLDFNSEMRISPDIATPVYLRYVQNMGAHTKTPDRRFYVYSFALKPEEAFPTGQVNMSRIITKLLTVTSVASAVPQELRIYAIGYNVLRVQNGLAGLLFNSTLTG